MQEHRRSSAPGGSVSRQGEAAQAQVVVTPAAEMQRVESSSSFAAGSPTGDPTSPRRLAARASLSAGCGPSSPKLLPSMSGGPGSPTLAMGPAWSSGGGGPGSPTLPMGPAFSAGGAAASPRRLAARASWSAGGCGGPGSPKLLPSMSGGPGSPTLAMGPAWSSGGGPSLAMSPAWSGGGSPRGPVSQDVVAGGSRGSTPTGSENLEAMRSQGSLSPPASPRPGSARSRVSVLSRQQGFQDAQPEDAQPDGSQPIEAMQAIFSTVSRQSISSVVSGVQLAAPEPVRAIAEILSPTHQDDDDDASIAESKELADDFIAQHFHAGVKAKREQDNERRKRQLRRREMALEMLGLQPESMAMSRSISATKGSKRSRCPSFMQQCWKFIHHRVGLQELHIQIIMKRLEVKEEPPTRPGMYKLAKNLRFEAVIGCLIALNSITIGWESFYKDGDERPPLLAASEHVFTVLFLIEFFIRILAFTWVWMISSPMNMFDTFLIWVTGVFVVWILPFLQVEEIDEFRNLGALRILRLTRLCRCIRLVPFFRELWILVHGVLECSRLIFWTWIIVGSIHFMFGVAVVELVAKSPTFEDDEDVQYYFGSLAKGMLTLFQVMTFDSWAAVLRPIMVRSPEATIVFILYLGIAGIVLVNLMTAIVVQNAFEQVKTDVEAVDHWKTVKERKFRQNLKQVFEDLDEDDSGFLTREEFGDALDDHIFIRQMKLLDIDCEELPDVYDILDDGDGQMSHKEFIEGLMLMREAPRNTDALHSQKLLEQHIAMTAESCEIFSDKGARPLQDSEAYLKAMHSDVQHVLWMCGEVLQKLNEDGIRILYSATEPHLPAAPLVPPPAPSWEVKAEATAQRARPASASRPTSASSRPASAGEKAPLPVPAPRWMHGYLKRLRKKKGEAAFGNCMAAFEQQAKEASSESESSESSESSTERVDPSGALAKLDVSLLTKKELAWIAADLGEKKLNQPLSYIALPSSMALPAREPLPEGNAESKLPLQVGFQAPSQVHENVTGTSSLADVRPDPPAEQPLGMLVHSIEENPPAPPVVPHPCEISPAPPPKHRPQSAPYQPAATGCPAAERSVRPASAAGTNREEALKRLRMQGEWRSIVARKSVV